eukprot:CAMPEP_0183581982 /NCGR_PEP_ID=MMETSP0371-20130417/148793_1 /TAXON_ID=268820 /ORGANISM="Peridinium aciculiferum, Strain PAER-2" /LENGTH=54 /DNA_ID=CAMNT_0025792695 /DNA_START=25 /DNA_END=186 /DNA_ORIENTATION=-
MRKEFFSVSAAWRMEDFHKWREWTTSSCDFVEVYSNHGEIWYHLETQKTLWEEF